MGIAFAILGLIVVGGIVGSVLNFAGPFLGLPLAFLFINAVIGKEIMERQSRILQMKRFRRDARAQKVRFDEKDKRTLV